MPSKPMKPLRRYTDRRKWNHEGFRALSDQEKLVWLYIADHCDNAGVWDGNTVAADRALGWQGELSPNWRGFLDSFNRHLSAPGRPAVMLLGSGHWWLTGFIRFQEGLDAGSEMNEQHFRFVPIFRSLRENGLLETFKELNPDLVFTNRATRKPLSEINNERKMNGIWTP